MTVVTPEFIVTTAAFIVAFEAVKVAIANPALAETDKLFMAEEILQACKLCGATIWTVELIRIVVTIGNSVASEQSVNALEAISTGELTLIASHWCDAFVAIFSKHQAFWAATLSSTGGVYEEAHM